MHHPDTTRITPSGARRGGNLEPLNAFVVYLRPIPYDEARDGATGSRRSMCGQRKYLAGKRRAAS
jgi:hypothetical protein